MFNEIVGQDDVKQMLLNAVSRKRVPHTILFSGPAGVGKLAMAVAFAKYLLCQNPKENDSCGECPTCKQIAKFAFPDLHFSFPVIKKGESTTCDDYMKEWYEMLKSSMYFAIDDWLGKINEEGKNAYILEGESDNIMSKMALSSFAGGYKVMIIWLPEKLREDAANNLLKTLEEPTPNSVFILVSNDASKIIDTIISRAQIITFRPLSNETIAEALQEHNGLSAETAMQIARVSGGSYLRALRMIDVNDESNLLFEKFASLMRYSYAKDLVNLKNWSEEIASWGREKSKTFLEYSLNMIRENFVYNFKRQELNFMNTQEAQFATKFSPFINERNVKGFMWEFSKALRDIEHNVNQKTMLFDLALKCIILIKK